MKSPIGTPYHEKPNVPEKIEIIPNTSIPTFNPKAKAKQITSLSVDGFKPFVKEIIKDQSGKATNVKISHAGGPILNSMHQIKASWMNTEAQYDPEVVDNWIPQMSLSVADPITGAPLTAADVTTRRNNFEVFSYFVNPMQDLDYIVLEAMARQTFIGPLMEALTKFIVGTGFKPELELINPSGDQKKDKADMESPEAQKIIDSLIAIDNQLNRDHDGELDTSFQEKITALISCTNLFNRAALIFGYDTPVKIDGKHYPQIPSSMKFAHARDLGIIQADPKTWRLKSVQWRNAYAQVPARDMIYLWNPVISAKTRNSWLYGDSMALPMLDASRVIRKMIGVNFPAMAEATWAGMYVMTVRPQGNTKKEKQEEYQDIASNLVRGGPNILLENPEDVTHHTVDFQPKVTEFKDLVEFLLRYCVSTIGLPQSMFYDESQSNRATMIGKIQLATSTVINPLRNMIGRQISSQWYQRWFRLLYANDKKNSEFLKKFRIKLAWDDLRIEEWFDKIEAVMDLDSRKQLKDEDFGELAGIENYVDKVEEGAETTPGGSGDGKGIDLGDGSKLKLDKTRQKLDGKKKLY
ncbi:MAG: hypothetical protein JKY15_02080 [Deltaproteobacteria bacterium]|nr:hypothetical protein [Deltaproteobacteria bacterium]